MFKSSEILSGTSFLAWGLFLIGFTATFALTGVAEDPYSSRETKTKIPLSEWTFWLWQSSVALAESARYSWERCQKRHPFSRVGIRERCWRPGHCLQRHLHSESIWAFHKVQRADGMKFCSTFLAALYRRCSKTTNLRLQLENSVFLPNLQPPY